MTKALGSGVLGTRPPLLYGGPLFPIPTESGLYFRRADFKFNADMDFDMNWWGVYAMPVGVSICFGPVLVAWIIAERKQQAHQKSNKRQK